MPRFPFRKSAQAFAQFLRLDNNSPRRAYSAHHLLPRKGGVPREVASKPSLFIQTPWRTRDSRSVIYSLPWWADKEAPMNTRIGALVLLALLVVLTGCGEGGTGSGTTNPVVVLISPSTADLNQGAAQSFTANVAVNWTVQEGSAGGSITNVGVYTAPNKSGTFHVIATSQADTTKSATAMVNIAAVGISLNTIGVTLDVGNQFPFAATVTGTVNTSVSWAIQEGASGGNITNSGLYTAPGTDGTFHVIATSQADTTRKGIATVTVAPLMVSVIPPSNLLGLLGVRDFIATVNTSLNATVTWSVQEGAAGGAITTGGQYTAPNTTGSFHVVATSVQDHTKNGIGNVTVVGSGFRPTGDMNAVRTGHTATLLTGGKVLIAGGDACFFFGYYYYGNCLLDSAEVYDVGTGTFSTTGKMSVTRDFHTATLLSNGKVLITGGHDASAELYDPTSGTFAATGSMSVGRNSHTATLLASGKVLIVGGQSVSGALATAELYDPTTGTFAATGTMAAARTSHTATLLANGKVLIAGGSNSAGATLATTELYDPNSGTNGTFVATGTMAAARTSHTATLLANGNVLITGGIADIANGISLSSAEVYDVGTGSFSATGPMMTVRDSHFAILLANGTVLVAGGSFGSTGGFTAELYNTGNGTFTETGGMETSRALAAAVLLLPDGRVFVSGGSDTNSAELYK
jgi:WD40 repeat protein